MGLLDYFSEAGNKLGGLLGGMPPDQSRAYNEFALGLLANSGWSKTPTTLGQNIGVAGLGALKAQDDFKRSSYRISFCAGSSMNYKRALLSAIKSSNLNRTTKYKVYC